MNPCSPVIVIGMHRSGTTLVTQMLEGMGLFIGKHLDKNREPLFFANLSNWLMRQSGAEWDHPEPFLALLEHAEIRAWTVQRLDCLLRSPRSSFYLGWKRYLRYRTPFNLVEPWGWKEPRNTFTLPLWLELFPNAKVIHIRRHGVDVAQSLKVRAERLFGQAKDNVQRTDWWRVRPAEATNTLRCLSLEGGLALWGAHLSQAQRQLQALQTAAHPVMDIRYEDFLVDPAPQLERLATFCGLDVSVPRINSLTGNIRHDRAWSYRKKPELAAFAERSADLLRAWDYEP